MTAVSTPGRLARRPAGATRTVVAFVTIGTVLLVVALVSVGLGSVRIPVGEVLAGLAGEGGRGTLSILWDVRLPRVGLALLIGANLAASGTLLQAVMHNPLADPGLTGVSSGAAVAVLFILLTTPQWTPLIPPAALQWLNGSLSGTGLQDVGTLAPYSLVGWIAALVCIRPANILRLGEQTAMNIGLNLTMARLLLSGVAVYLAAISVSTVGLIGFVGLVVPHITRMLVGSNYLVRMPFALALGAVVLVIADTLGRTVISPLEIPAGIVMAVAGGPYFLYLMRRGGT